MADEQKKAWGLGSDLPLRDPAEDQFGYDGFAALLAKAIVSNQHPQGLVLAVHGKWGSGKSSLMNFIKHHLTAMPQDSRPVLIDFNPWWFEGREDTATQLLNQFSAQLSDRRSDLRKLAKLIAKYSKVIANTAADLSGYGWISKPLGWLLKIFPNIKWLQEPKGIPAIKKKVAAALKSSGKRFVFFIDDIDRLTPDETRDLFRAIKALADFPEVVYVLFFDREEVAKSLSASLKMDGEAYLEKIVQAPFHLPAVDELRLRLMLFNGLDSIVESQTMPFPFDAGRWNEVFFGALCKFIKKPRDVVRILNSVSVVYPPLAGEVNPVDFIALEFLRVFEPSAYVTIRDAPGMFCGVFSGFQGERDKETAFIERWSKALTEGSREHVIALVSLLFPKVQQHQTPGLRVYSQSHWSRALRPCSAACFPVYFQFGVPAGHVSRADLELITSAETVEGMSAQLLEASKVILPQGHSKARDILERLQDFHDLSPEQSFKLVEALTANAHLILGLHDEKHSTVNTPNQWRFQWLISVLLEHHSVPVRQELLANLAATSPGLWMLVAHASCAIECQVSSANGSFSYVELEKDFAEGLAKSVADRLNKATLKEFMVMPELGSVVLFWVRWGDSDRIRDVFLPATETDSGLLCLLDKFVTPGRIQAGSKVTEFYALAKQAVTAVLDVRALEPRLSAFQFRDDLTLRQKYAVDYCLQLSNDDQSEDASAG